MKDNKIPSLDELLALESNDIEVDDENRGRALIDLSSPVNMDLHQRSEVNTQNKELINQAQLEADEALVKIYEDIYTVPELNFSVIAKLVSELMPVEEIAQLFCVGRDELIAFVEGKIGISFMEFIAKHQTKPKHDMRRWLMESAESDNPQTLLFVSKNFLGLKDQPDDKGKAVVFVEMPDLGSVPEKKK